MPLSVSFDEHSSTTFSLRKKALIFRLAQKLKSFNIIFQTSFQEKKNLLSVFVVEMENWVFSDKYETTMNMTPNSHPYFSVRASVLGFNMTLFYPSYSDQKKFHLLWSKIWSYIWRQTCKSISFSFHKNIENKIQLICCNPQKLILIFNVPEYWVITKNIITF